ncbi:beta-keto acid cleavage family enzyme [Celeribacter sp. ULVN23_4]
MPLPQLMVAPNGATKTKADHPALPISMEELTQTARDCFAAGAGGFHLHLRDEDGRHLLDTGAYREAVRELSAAVPEMALQITTEASGVYLPAHQRHVALNSGAAMVSVALREMLRDEDAEARRFYARCAEHGIAIQHILYDVADAEALHRVLPDEVLQSPDLQLLFVLGRYTAGQSSAPIMLTPFVAWMHEHDLSPDWAVCAFGQGETLCLKTASRLGGKCRVGFENSLVHEDGRPAQNNAERVAAVRAAIAEEVTEQSAAI